MGLNMYLELKIYKESDAGKTLAEAIGSNDEALAGVEMKSSCESYEVGYWCKAYAIRDYFESLVGEDGILGCRDYYFNMDDLVDLKSRCEKVLKAKREAVGDEWKEVAEEELPISPDWLWGDHEPYDKWYLYDLAKTVSIIDRALLAIGKLEEMHIYPYICYCEW